MGVILQGNTIIQGQTIFGNVVSGTPAGTLYMYGTPIFVFDFTMTGSYSNTGTTLSLIHI